MIKKKSNYSRTWLPGLRTWGRFSPVLLISVLLSVIALLTYIHRKKMNIISKYGTQLYLCLVAQGFLPDTAKMITAQAAHESGNFTSPIFIHNNNPFGMKLPEIRMTTAIGEYKGHAVYSDLDSAAKDYWLYYTAQKFPYYWKDTDSFVTALKLHNYFEADTDAYKTAVKNFYKLYFGGI